jgi:ribosomal protein S12 methylthiotransferase accessory factor
MADDEIRDWLADASVDQHDYLLADVTVEPRTSRDLLDRSRDDLGADIELCSGIMESKGLEVLVLDQTRQDIGLPVVKVFVPGLRHFWARFAPGRLYDVPVATGRLALPRTESELNPTPMFI